ncbi:MAG: SIS domain-containing protein [Clostridiaceae bacterium]|nr:SIS domain-containing protein [Clostridiaceae bacterium]
MSVTYDNAMRRQVMSLPELMDAQYADLEPKTRSILSFQEIYSCQRIILTGCGDSYAASMAMKPIFEILTGIKVDLIPALELCRYTPEKLLTGNAFSPLVIVVSNSGGAARLSEAVQRCNKYGAFTMAITGKPESPVGMQAKRVLQLEIPRFESAPGTRSYMVCLMALELLAIRMGEVRGRYPMDQASVYRHEVRDQGKALAEMMPQIDASVLEIAEAWKNLSAFDYIGAGFDYAAAWFGHAKMLEATGRYSMHINSEEWFHLNCFLKNLDQIGTVVIANTTNPGLSRTKEMIKAAAGMGRKMMIVTDGTKEDFGVDAYYVRVPKPGTPYSMPLTQFVPVCLLAAYLMAMDDEKQCRGCAGPWEFCQGAAGLKNSEIVII